MTDPRWHFGGPYGYEFDCQIIPPVGSGLSSRLESQASVFLGDLETYRRLSNLQTITQYAEDSEGNFYEYGFRMGRPYAVILVRQQSVRIETVSYKGLAYAGYNTNGSGAIRTYSYPYAGTTNNYGTEYAASNSAAPGTLNVKQTVARLVGRVGGVYADKLRGIPEGSHIQAYNPHYYWVKEAVIGSSGTSFRDTDDVYTSAGNMIVRGGNVIGAYAYGFSGGSLRRKAVAFPYAGKLIVISPENGYSAWIPPLASIGYTATQDGSDWHLEPDSTYSPESFLTELGFTVVATINQSGTGFVLCDGDGKLFQYAMGTNGTTGLPEVTLSRSVDDGFSAQNTSAISGSVGSSSLATPAYDTTGWSAGLDLDRAYCDEDVGLGGPITGYATYITTGAIQSDTYSYSIEWDLAGSISDTQTIGCMYVDDAAVDVTLTYSVVRAGTVLGEERMVWSGQEMGAPNDPPAGKLWKYSYLGPTGITSTTLPSYTNMSVGALSAPTITDPGGPQAWGFATRKTISGCSMETLRTVAWGAKSLNVSRTYVEFADADVYYTAHADYPIDITSDDGGDTYETSSTGTVATYGGTVAVSAVQETRNILLIDEHNAVLVYVESVQNSSYSVDMAGASVGFLKGTSTPFDGEVSAADSHVGSSDLTHKLVLKIGTSTYEKSLPTSTADYAASTLFIEDQVEGFYQSCITPLYVGIANPSPLRIPTSQGAAPYIAYRNPKIGTRELILAYDESMSVLGGSNQYLRGYLTESGVEDWLTECGLPSPIKEKLATCFRVG